MRCRLAFTGFATTRKKGPKGPHIVHLSTMCQLCFQLSFVEFCLAVSNVKSRMTQLIICRGGHLSFQINLSDLVKDVKILLHFKFH